MEFKVERALCILVLLLISETSQTQCKKILCLLGLETENAQTWNKILLNELSAKGHELTIFTPTIWHSEAETNIEFIHLENTMKFLQTRHKENSINANLFPDSIWKLIINWYDQQMATCRGNLESIGLSEFFHMTVKEKRLFDLIIYDVTYGPGCLLPMAHLFSGIPIVGITSSTLTSDVLSMNHNSVLNAAVDPYPLSDFGRSMSYWIRLYNMALYGFDYFYRKCVVRPVLEGLWTHYTKTNDIYAPKTVDELIPRFKVILANYHPVLHTLTALPFNVVPVPGLHIKSKSNFTASTSLSKFIENYASGIVLIDLDLKQLGETNLLLILESIRKFSNYGFIWKLNENTIDVPNNKPKNLFVDEELKNQELFNLPAVAYKIKFVLTIPEILRIQECIYHAIPIITITLSLDQSYLAKRIEEQGLALNLQPSNLTALISSFENFLTNANIRNTALQLHKSFVNQQNAPLDTAVWWVEHLLKNPQANDHLYAANNNNLVFLSRTSLDIVLLFEVLIAMLIVNMILVCRQTWKNFAKMSNTKNKSVKKEEEKTKKLKKDKKNKAKKS